jgi:hypothetical protein
MKLFFIQIFCSLNYKNKEWMLKMARFLIELEHEADSEACKRAYDIILSSGSHFLTNADWGCEDNEHCCWIIVDLGSKEEVRSILPPIYRNEARIVQLKHYELKDFNESQKTHRD